MKATYCINSLNLSQHFILYSLTVSKNSFFLLKGPRHFSLYSLAYIIPFIAFITSYQPNYLFIPQGLFIIISSLISSLLINLILLYIKAEHSPFLKALLPLYWYYPVTNKTPQYTDKKIIACLREYLRWNAESERSHFRCYICCTVLLYNAYTHIAECSISFKNITLFPTSVFHIY